MKSATKGVAGGVVDLARRARLLDPAGVHDEDAIRHRLRLFLVVGHHDRGHVQTTLDVADLAPQPGPDLCIQRRQRLVEEQQPGRGSERARERDSLLLPTRELGRVLGRVSGQVDEREQLVDAPPDGGPVHLLVHQTEADVGRDGQVREQGVGLEDDSEVALRGRQPGDVPPGGPDAAVALCLQSRDAPEQRRLSASGRTQEADELAPRDGEADVGKRAKGSEVLGQRCRDEIRRVPVAGNRSDHCALRDARGPCAARGRIGQGRAFAWAGLAPYGKKHGRAIDIDSSAIVRHGSRGWCRNRGCSFAGRWRKT